MAVYTLASQQERHYLECIQGCHLTPTCPSDDACRSRCESFRIEACQTNSVLGYPITTKYVGTDCRIAHYQGDEDIQTVYDDPRNPSYPEYYQ